MRNGGSRTYEGTAVVTVADKRVKLYGNRETARMEESCCLQFSPRQARAIARRILELTEGTEEGGLTLSPRQEVPAPTLESDLWRQEEEPEGEVVRTFRQRVQGVGTVGTLYSAKVRMNANGFWQGFVVCTHLDSFGRALSGMGKGVTCWNAGTFPDRESAARAAEESLWVRTVGMVGTIA